jgi:DNA-binding transcriptional MocR family regulator
MIELIRTSNVSGPAVKRAAALAAFVEELVRTGRVAPEEQLPSVRELADALGLSPGTVASAYRTLREHGVVVADGRRGTRVLPRPVGREYAEAPSPPGSLDLVVANPDLALLPDLRRHFAALDPRSGLCSAPALEPALAARMRKEFERDRIPAAHLVVTSGAIPALHRALAAWGGPGDKVAVEDPGFNDHHQSVAALGRTALPVEVDEQGLVPASLKAALRAGAKAVLLTARAQSPTGASTGRARALELRAIFAAWPAVGVAVDDYLALLCDGPLPALVPWERSRFLVVRSLNKPLAPDLRVAVAAADATTAERVERDQGAMDVRVSAYIQRVAAAALGDRAVRASLERARRIYQERRTALLRALRSRGLRATGASGLNVWIPVPDEGAATAGLLAAGFSVRPGARYRLSAPPGIRVTTSTLAPRDAERLADALAALSRPGSQRGAP